LSAVDDVGLLLNAILHACKKNSLKLW